MKILLANKFFFLNGGSERVFFQERDHLLKKKLDVIDFSMDDQRNYSSSFSPYFISHIDFTDRPGGLLKKIKQGIKFIHSHEAVKKIGRLIEKERPDIAHLHNIYHQLTPSIIPVPNFSGYFDDDLALAYATMFAIVLPTPGRIPIKVPIKELLARFQL